MYSDVVYGVLRFGVVFFSHIIVKSYVMFLFFFKQKTAYEWRISAWSSDVCSSDLPQHRRLAAAGIADDRRKALVAGNMRQRPALLGRQVKPPALGRRQRAGHMGVGDTMPPVDRQPLGRAFQPLLGRDHVAR